MGVISCIVRCSKFQRCEWKAKSKMRSRQSGGNGKAKECAVLSISRIVKGSGLFAAFRMNRIVV